MSNPPQEKDEKKEQPPEVSPEQVEVAPRVSFDNFQEHFPALHSEITQEEMTLDLKRDESTDDDPLSKYLPDVFDFLARAKTDQEGHEIINFLEKDGQLEPEQATNVREQLSTNGIRSFGPLRTKNHYYHEAAEVRQRRLIEKRYDARRRGL